MNIRNPWPAAIFRHGKVFENRTKGVNLAIHKMPLLVLVVASQKLPTISERLRFFQKTGIECNTQEPRGALVGAICVDWCYKLLDPPIVQLYHENPNGVSKWMDGPVLWHISEKYEFDIHLPNVKGCQSLLRYLEYHPDRDEIVKHLQFEMCDK